MATKKGLQKAVASYHQKQAVKAACERAERLTVSDYPYSHNPYLPHTPVADCYADCVIADEEK